MEKYICTLEVKECDYKGKDGACTLDKAGCGFRIMESDNQSKEKPKKWYEAYMK